MQLNYPNALKNSVLYDPELPTAKDVLSAICCVATHYAIKPSLDLAALAADLSLKLTAPEYADSALSKEIAKRLLSQWSEIVSEHQSLQAKVLPVHATLQ